MTNLKHLILLLILTSKIFMLTITSFQSKLGSNRQPKDDRIKRAISSLNINYQFNEKLSFQARASLDYSNKTYEQQHYASSNPTNTGDNGRWDLRDLMMNSSMLMESFLIQTILVMT